MEEFARLLDAGCEELGIVLTEKQKEQFFKYFQLLTEWNQVMNLTAITEMLFLIKDRPLSLNPEGHPAGQLLDKLIGFVLEPLKP